MPHRLAFLFRAPNFSLRPRSRYLIGSPALIADGLPPPTVVVRSDSRKIQGLAAVFVEATPLLADVSVPQILKDQCAAQNLPTQGNAAGNQDPNNLKGLPEGPFLQILGWRPKGIGAMFGYVLAPAHRCVRNLIRFARVLGVCLRLRSGWLL